MLENVLYVYFVFIKNENYFFILLSVLKIGSSSVFAQVYHKALNRYKLK